MIRISAFEARGKNRLPLQDHQIGEDREECIRSLHAYKIAPNGNVGCVWRGYTAVRVISRAALELQRR